eukprot:16435917-Heterocapsa_arctica.AAC.1
MEEILGIQEDTRKIMKAGFEEQGHAFDQEHIYNSENFKYIEDDLRELRHMKRKSNQMDPEMEEVPEEP